MMNDKWIVYNGELHPSAEPLVPANSRSIMYGDGIFETFRTYACRTFAFQQHWERLLLGMETLGLSRPAAFEQQPLLNLIYSLLDKNKLKKTQAVVRLQLWREGDRGYGTGGTTESKFAITASECPSHFAALKLATVDTRRIPSESLPTGFKICNGINYILAVREAAGKGADDALMQTIDDYISETTKANIFWIKADKIFTPSDSCDLIAGITRKMVKGLIEQHPALWMEEGSYKLSDIRNADGVFICNSVREIQPVKQLDDCLFDADHAAILELKQLFAEKRNQNLEGPGP